MRLCREHQDRTHTQLSPMSLLAESVFAAGLVLAAPVATAQSCTAPVDSSATRWERWEQTLATNQNYLANSGNPYRQVHLRATFVRQGSSEQFAVDGFWDGGNTFRFRSAFPNGTWNWTTSCTSDAGSPLNCANDPALHGRCGAVAVNALYPGGDPRWLLYNRGFLKASSNARYLTYADGTPFFWLADTAWVAPVIGSTTGDWVTYLEDRLLRGFTAVLTGLAPDWAWVPTPAAFTATGGCTPNNSLVPNSCSQWAPTYWQGLDAKVKAANDRGLVVMLTGLNDPLDQGSGSGASSNQHLYPWKDDAVAFARNLIARMAGSFVVYSGGFDDPRTATNTHQESQDTILKAITDLTRPPIGNNRQLATMHLAGGASSAADYAAFQNHVHFHTFQSGHAGNTAQCNSGESRTHCALRRAREMPLYLGGYTNPTAPLRPLTNAEALYESALTNPVEPDTPNRARQAGYLTTLSGSFGYTLGSGHPNCSPVNASCPWSTAQGIWPWVQPLTHLNSVASQQMTYLRNLFYSRPWKDLVPQHCSPATAQCGNLIKNQGTAADQKMAIAVTTNSKFAMAYLPNNTTIRLDTARFTGLTSTDCRWAKTWWNPRSGNSEPVLPQQMEPTGTNDWSLTVPPSTGCPEARGTGACDWVLTLEDVAPTCTRDTGTKAKATSLRVWQGQKEGAGVPGIYAQLDDGSEEAVSPEVEVSTVPGSFLKAPRVAREPGGSYLIVWEGENQDGSLWGVFARRVSASGLALGQAFAVNTTTDLDQHQPAVIGTPGGFIVIWTSEEQDGDRGGIFARLYSATGQPLSGEMQIHSTAAGHQDYPQVASDAAGNLIAAWESATSDGGRAVFAQRLDSTATKIGSEWRVTPVEADNHDLVSLTVDPLGNFIIEWQKADPAGNDLGRFAQRFDVQGLALGGVVQTLAGSDQQGE